MSDNKEKAVKKITTHQLTLMKQRGEKISMLTAYDYSFARIFDESGIDVILVGDSASNVISGNETTLPITLDQMIYHATSVVKAVSRCLVVVDVPFGEYQGSPQDAFKSSVRIMKESGAHAVKMEGGSEVIDSIQKVVGAGIPVMGHLGLMPQSIYKYGTYSVRAKSEAEADKLKKDALLLQEAGCFGIVLEKIPARLARHVSESLEIPVIGIGSGIYVDGQVLVMHDLLGINKDFNPRFIRRYANLYEGVMNAVTDYIVDVKARDFPSDKESY